MDSFERDVKMLDNPYGTKDLLGFGTYAATYKQDTNSLQKIEIPSNISVVAIKKFFPDEENDDYNARTLAKERAILETVRGYPGVVTYYNSMGNFLYMEYLGDNNLSRWWNRSDTLANKNLALIKLLQGLSSALVFLRERGVIHFDIKADNVMLRENDPGHPVLIDFGRSIQASGPVEDQDWGADGPPCGAYCCQPPEILHLISRHYNRRPPTHCTFDARVDVYCTAVMIYHLFCDEYPNGFYVSEVTSVLPLLENIAQREWVSNAVFSKMDPKLRDVVGHMLTENHLYRPEPETVLASADFLLASRTPVPVVWSEDES